MAVWVLAASWAWVLVLVRQEELWLYLHPPNLAMQILDAAPCRFGTPRLLCWCPAQRLHSSSTATLYSRQWRSIPATGSTREYTSERGRCTYLQTVGGIGAACVTFCVAHANDFDASARKRKRAYTARNLRIERAGSMDHNTNHQTQGAQYHSPWLLDLVYIFKMHTI